MIEKVTGIPTGSVILVTGGAGFIGSHLVEALVNASARVTVIDDLSTGSKENIESVLDQVDFLRGDMGERLRQGDVKVEDYDYIFHLAANSYIPPSVEDPARDYRSNLLNTFELIEQLRILGDSGPRLVNTSTAGVYGNPAKLPIEEGDPTVPISPYGVSKLAAERYVSVYSDLYGIRANSLRLFSVFGPRQRKQVVYS
jgi:UDP-glucose 4-epimerase